ncbi:MAG TPA: response regulator [Chthoniobacteraceae bacterium]|jgi:signal transduction histidine kinase|nr:response regulator [Chthoniobacteraceae bacterium]
MPNSIISKARVLLVDDEISNVRLLERILEMIGCAHVWSTNDPRQVMPLYLEHQPDIILMDLHMPYLDGFALLDLFRTTLPAEQYLPILILTADITMETRRRALAAGAKDLVTKPIDHSEVLLRMKNLLENRFLHQELQRQNEFLEQQVRERTAEVESTLRTLRSTQEAVVRQERLSALGMMAGGIAHDFNNALAMVLGYSELLLPYLQNHAPARERGYMHNVMMAAQDATHVVARLGAFYRPAGDEIRVAVNLNDLILQIVALTAPKWSSERLASGVQIQVDKELCEVASVLANASELREVLTNLIFNAVDALPKGGHITVGTHGDGTNVVLSVSDTGIGMTDAERERCLEPFFSTKGERGTGLGLAVVYGIVQRHGGTIEIQSVKGEGTTFEIRLPAAAAPASEAPAACTEVDRALRILVVDDMEIICELMVEYLQGDGHHVVFSTSAKQALEQFRDGAFDLVITDQSMPEMNGVQLAAAIKAHEPLVPVILLTGFGEEMHAKGNMPQGIDLVVGKPISAADLRHAIFTVTSHLPAEEPAPVAAGVAPRQGAAMLC